MLTAVGEDAYQIEDLANEKSLDLRDWDESDNARIVLWDKNGGKNQLWELVDDPPDWVKKVRASGIVWAWGENNNERLGIGPRAGDVNENTPKRVHGLEEYRGQSAVAVAGGVEHSLALLDDGSVWSWGENNNGRLGLGQRAGDVNEKTAQRVEFADKPGMRATSIAAGEWHSLATLEDGSVWAWGSNIFNQLGINRDGGPDEWEPRKVRGFERNEQDKAIAVAAYHGLARI